MASKNKKLVEKSIRGLIKKTYIGKHYHNHELKEIVKSIIVTIGDIPEEFEAIQFMVRYIHKSTDEKCHFNLKKLQKNKIHSNNFLEFLKGDDDDISTEELEKILEKEISKTQSKTKPYVYPIIPMNYIQHFGPEHPPSPRRFPFLLTKPLSLQQTKKQLVI